MRSVCTKFGYFLQFEPLNHAIIQIDFVVDDDVAVFEQIYDGIEFEVSKVSGVSDRFQIPSDEILALFRCLRVATYH